MSVGHLGWRENAESGNHEQLNNAHKELRHNLPTPETESNLKRATLAELYPTPHFVPEGISSSLRDFIVLVLNIEVFQIKFS